MKIHSTPNTSQNVRQSTTANPIPIKPSPHADDAEPCANKPQHHSQQNDDLGMVKTGNAIAVRSMRQGYLDL